MRCDRCKFWNTGEMCGGQAAKEWDDHDKIRPLVAECTKARPYWDTTEWKPVEGSERIQYVRSTRPEFVGLKMFVQDGSDYRAVLLTTPDFFCAHFDAVKS